MSEQDQFNKITLLILNLYRDMSNINNIKELKEFWTKLFLEYMKLYGKTNDTILFDFSIKPEIVFSFYPKICQGYEGEDNTIKFNILSIIYSETTNNKIVFTPMIKNAGNFIHEFDHYRFFLENNMIYKKGHIREEFDKENKVMAEVRAYEKQIAFYENSKKFLNKDIYLYLISPSDIFDIEKEYKRFKYITSSTDDMLNNFIDVCKTSIEIVKNNADKYDQSNENNDIKTIKKINSLFKFKIDINKLEKDYNKIRIELK